MEQRLLKLRFFFQKVKSEIAIPFAVPFLLDHLSGQCKLYEVETSKPPHNSDMLTYRLYRIPACAWGHWLGRTTAEWCTY